MQHKLPKKIKNKILIQFLILSAVMLVLFNLIFGWELYRTARTVSVSVQRSLFAGDRNELLQRLSPLVPSPFCRSLPRAPLDFESTDSGCLS